MCSVACTCTHKHWFEQTLWLHVIAQRTSASRNQQIMYNRDPENTPEYSEFLYLFGNRCSAPVVQDLLNRGSLKLFHLGAEN